MLLLAPEIRGFFVKNKLYLLAPTTSWPAAPSPQRRLPKRFGGTKFEPKLNFDDGNFPKNPRENTVYIHEVEHLNFPLMTLLFLVDFDFDISRKKIRRQHTKRCWQKMPPKKNSRKSYTLRLL